MGFFGGLWLSFFWWGLERFWIGGGLGGAVFHGIFRVLFHHNYVWFASGL